MRQAFSKFELRALSSTIAIVILLGSLSLFAGLAVVSGPAHPELTVDICQPLQASGLTTITLLARPAPPQTASAVMSDVGSTVVKKLIRFSADPVAPDTPPPKPLV